MEVIECLLRFCICLERIPRAMAAMAYMQAYSLFALAERWWWDTPRWYTETSREERRSLAELMKDQCDFLMKQYISDLALVVLSLGRGTERAHGEIKARNKDRWSLEGQRRTAHLEIGGWSSEVQ